MRPQVTVYLHTETREWLEAYAKERGLKQSEVVRLLVEREKQIRWLEWALRAQDPAQGTSTAMPWTCDALPPRWNEPPLGGEGKRKDR